MCRYYIVHSSTLGFSSKYSLFADDVKIFQAVSGKNGTALLQNDINHFLKWYTENTSLNTDKCQTINFSRKVLSFILRHKIDDIAIPEKNLSNTWETPGLSFNNTKIMMCTQLSAKTDLFLNNAHFK